jgi:uncharacterized protein
MKRSLKFLVLILGFTFIGPAYSDDLQDLKDVAMGQEDKPTKLKAMEVLADQGNPYAQAMAGEWYRRQDDVKGVGLIKLAAEQGLPMAQVNLSRVYFEGQGVLQDYELAYMWANIAASHGDKPILTNGEPVAEEMLDSDVRSVAIDMRDSLEKLLLMIAPNILATAQQRARECLASGYRNC